MVSCTTTPASDDVSCYSEKDPPRNSDQVTIDQGIWGNVWLWKGNFMPVAGQGEKCPVQRMVYVYELTTREETDQVEYKPFFSEVYTDLIVTAESGEDGFFEIELEPGTYSIFVAHKAYLYSNSFGSQGEISPVKVEANQVSEVPVNITSEAVF